jgi:hypothetical protein
MRRFLLTLIGVLAFSAVGLTVAAAAVTNAAARDASGEVASLTFTDPHGREQTAPYFSVAGAYPGMKTQVSPVTLRNSGTVDLAFVLSAKFGAEGPGPSLADALRVTVAHEGTTLYRGRLADLTLEGPEILAAGESAAMRIAIDWPDGPNDNAYQGLSLDFTLQARGTDAA